MCIKINQYRVKRKKWQKLPIFCIFQGKKGRYTDVNLIFEEKKLILCDNLGQHLKNRREKKGQYTSLNLIFVNFLTNIMDFNRRLGAKKIQDMSKNILDVRYSIMHIHTIKNK